MKVKAKVNAALVAAGFNPRDRLGQPRDTYLDKRLDGTRRLKFVYGEFIFDASQEKQRRLERELRRQFGDQYLGGYFIRRAFRGWEWSIPVGDRDNYKSFCLVFSSQLS